MTVGFHESIERLHEMPCRTVHLRRETRMDVGVRPATPLLPARDKLQLDNSLCAEVELYRAVEVLTSEWNDHADVLRSAAATSGFNTIC